MSISSHKSGFKEHPKYLKSLTTFSLSSLKNICTSLFTRFKFLLKIIATVFLTLILSSCLSNISDILLIKNCNEETVKESKTISSAYACILTRLKHKKQPTLKFDILDRISSIYILNRKADVIPPCLYSCFLDMSKSFERVNHDLLLSKLANKGLPTQFVRIFKSVYAQTTVKVREINLFRTAGEFAPHKEMPPAVLPPIVVSFNNAVASTVEAPLRYPNWAEQMGNSFINGSRQYSNNLNA